VRLDDEEGTALVIVPDYQLSLAIGKEGQNARLAARLTGWHVEIKSETQVAEEEAEQAEYASDDWAEGEWVTDPETGEQVWKSAEGGPALSAGEWSEAATTAADDDAPEGSAPPADADADADADATSDADTKGEPVAEGDGEAPAADDAETSDAPEGDEAAAEPEADETSDEADAEPAAEAPEADPAPDAEEQ
jgi:N utilization substance protein A